MKTSILHSLLILITFVVPLVSTPLLASHDDDDDDSSGDKKAKCEYSIKKGNKGKDCPIVDAVAGALEVSKKGQKAEIMFTFSKQAKKHIEIKYQTLVTFNEDTKKCNKEAKKISKKKQKFKMHNHKHQKNQLVFTHNAKVSNRKECTVSEYELLIYKIKDGNLGEVTQAGGNEPPPPPIVDPTVKVSAGTIIEGDEGESMLEFTVELSSEPVRPMLINYRTDPGTALPGEDFVDTTGQVSFGEPQVATFSMSNPLIQTVQVPVIGDLAVEDDEQFTICTVTEIEGVAGPEVFTQATIIDNDVILTVSKVDQLKNLRQMVYTEATLRVPGQENQLPITGLDLEGDGDEDIVVIYALPYDNQVGEVVVYRNDNTTDTGWIIEPTGIITNAGSNTMLVNDFNGDGLDDLFIVNPFYTDNHVALMQVSGSLVQSDVVAPLLGAYGSKGYHSASVTHASGDLDNDGDMDVFIISQSDSYGYYNKGHVTYINDGAGNFAPEYRTDYRTRGIHNQWAYSAAIGDFNNDGTNEIFIGTNGYEFNEADKAGQYNQLFGNNNMLMANTGEIIDNAVSRVTNDVCEGCTNFATNIDVKAIDINGDGWMDIVTQNSDTSAGNEMNARIDVYLGNNDGTFDLSQSLWNGTEMDARLAFEDVNGDGYLDIIGLPANQQQTYWYQVYTTNAGLDRTESVVYVNDGSGYFAEDANVTIDKVSILSGMFFLTQNLEYIPTELK